jgi:hypothetical protein
MADSRTMYLDTANTLKFLKLTDNLPARNSTFWEVNPEDVRY